MVPRFLLSLLLLSSTSVFASSLALGPERELAPSTTALRFNGEARAIAAGGDGFLAVWTLPQTLDAYATRLDASGRPMDPVGVAQPARLLTSAAAWNGREYVIAGLSSGNLVVMRVGADGTLVDAQPRVIAEEPYAFDLRLTFNGEVLLVTWATQSVLTQTLAGVILEPDLDVVNPTFVITTRKLPEIPMAGDHATSHSVATAGDDFLIAWENVRTPNTHTFVTVDRSGKVEQGATIDSESPLLEPVVVTDSGGFIVVWHDRSAIHARRITSDGTPVSELVTLAFDEGIQKLLAVGNESETGVVWMARGSVMCPYETSPNPTLRSARFDAAFNAIDPPRTLSSAAQRLYANDVAATRTSIVTTWTSSGCSYLPRFANATALDEPSTWTTSATYLPSSQLDPAAASDGEQGLVVWSEQRDENPAPRIYAALLDDAANDAGSPIAVGTGDAGQTKPRIAYGSGRYLVTWNEDASVVAQFVHPNGSVDGDPFVVANTSASPELVWNGEAFVLVWADGQMLRSRRVSVAGALFPGPSLNVGASVMLAGVTTGAGGEIAALYRAEHAQSMSVRVAMMRARWSDEQTLVSVKRPCSSLACDDYIPLAVGWSGARYLATWMKTGGPGRLTYLESSTLEPIRRQLALSVSYPNDVSGAMVWAGTSFVLVYRSRGVSSSWLQTHVLRVSEDGQPLDALGGLRVSELTSDAGSPPDIALVRPARAVVVYNRDPVPFSYLGTPQRVLARSVTINPRRRAVR